MRKPKGPKKCFGEYGFRFGPENHDPVECFTCELEKHCYQMTVADAVQSTAGDLSFLIDSLEISVEREDGPQIKVVNPRKGYRGQPSINH